MESDMAVDFCEDQGVSIEALTKNSELQTLEASLLKTMEDYRQLNKRRTFYTNRNACADIPPDISALLYWACETLDQPHVVCIRAMEYFRRYLIGRYNQLKQQHGSVTTAMIFQESQTNSLIVRCLVCIQIAAKWNSLHGIIPLEDLKNTLKSMGEEITNKELVIIENRVLETLDFRMAFPTLADYKGTLMSLLSIRLHYTSPTKHVTFVENYPRISEISKDLIILYCLDTKKFFKNIFDVYTVPLTPGSSDSRSSWLDVKNNELLVAACSIAGAIQVMNEEDLLDSILTELSAFTDIPVTDIEIVTPILVDLLRCPSEASSESDQT